MDARLFIGLFAKLLTTFAATSATCIFIEWRLADLSSWYKPNVLSTILLISMVCSNVCGAAAFFLGFSCLSCIAFSFFSFSTRRLIIVLSVLSNRLTRNACKARLCVSDNFIVSPSFWSKFLDAAAYFVVFLR